MRYDDDRALALVSAVVDGDIEFETGVPQELAHDLRFQAELAHYRRIRRTMRSLRHEVLDPGFGLLDEILVSLDDEWDRSVVRGRRVIYLGGLAAATAAGVGSAIVLARRRGAA